MQTRQGPGSAVCLAQSPRHFAVPSSPAYASILRRGRDSPPKSAYARPQALLRHTSIRLRAGHCSHPGSSRTPEHTEHDEVYPNLGAAAEAVRCQAESTRLGIKRVRSNIYSENLAMLNRRDRWEARAARIRTAKASRKKITRCRRGCPLRAEGGVDCGHRLPSGNGASLGGHA
jgi:hypothetical protein